MKQLDLIPTVTEKKGIILKFDTDQHVFDAETMGKILLAFNTTVLAFSQVSQANSVKLNVSSVQPGCIEIGAVISALSSAGAKIDFLKTIYEHIKDLFKLYVFLNGQPPQRVEPVSSGQRIENHIGEHAIFNNPVFNVYNMLPSAPLGDMDRLSNTPGLKGIKILDDNRQAVVDVKKEDFPKFVPHNKTLSQQDDIKEEQEVELHLNTITLFDNKKAWNFVYSETPVTAKITDENFLTKIQNGLSFRRGDRIRAIWTLYKKFDVAANCHIIKKREITAVLEYIPRSIAEQGKLF